MHFFLLVGNPGILKGSGYLGGWDQETPQTLQTSLDVLKEARTCCSKGIAALQNVR